MKYNIYSVYDNVAEKYGKPFVAENDKLAIREFSIGISGLNAIIKKDYVLVKIGSFDDENGAVGSFYEDFVVLSGEYAKVEDGEKDNE